MKVKSNIKNTLITLSLFVSFYLFIYSFTPVVATDLSGEYLNVVKERNKEERLIGLIKSSTFLLQISTDDDIEDEYSASGTGFAIDSTHLITNFHVIDGAKTIKIFSFEGIFFVEATVEYTDAENDLAYLVINDTDNYIFRSFYPLAMNTIHLRYLETIYIAGYPFGDSLSITSGTYNLPSALIPSMNKVDVSVAPGNSGGPVIRYNPTSGKYEVIGVISAHMSTGDGRNYSTHGLIVPIERVHELISNDYYEEDEFGD